MIPSLRWLLVVFLIVVLSALPGNGQSPAKIMPKLEPVAETRLLMEGLVHPNFRGLEKHLSPKPADDKAWVFARGQALLLAETANLLMLRPPRNQGEAVWFERSIDLRNRAVQLAQQLARKDLDASKTSLRQLAVSCNRCHQTFRVGIEITPFQPADPAPPKVE